MALPPCPVVLTGKHVRIEPLGLEHVADLAACTADDDEVWQWIAATPHGEAGMRGIVEDALVERERGERFAFAIIDLATGRAVGSSSYLDIFPADDRIEIGWTFYARSVWRSAVNSETKLLLLTDAFETLGYERVMLKTHHNNARSQAAITRLGGIYEGTFRHHRVHWDGTRRNSMFYSILSAEWPPIRDRLSARNASS